ncbi:MAG: CBS domain-containing protein, partial [Planctomycetes bacterium]|nr:CBS domain-containing protein [Planctomycetota bacterium]
MSIPKSSQENLASLPPQTIVATDIDCTVSDAARKMRDHNVGCIIVNDKQGRLAGILSERDIV